MSTENLKSMAEKSGFSFIRAGFRGKVLNQEITLLPLSNLPEGRFLVEEEQWGV
jgi:hypothetical protein